MDTSPPAPDVSGSPSAKRFRMDDTDAPVANGSNSTSGSPPHRQAAPPVKAACLFCRARKSKCDGKQPCKTCILKNQECIYKASRRGAKRKHHDPTPIQAHLDDLLGLSNLPHNVRVPGLVPQLRLFQQPVDLSKLSSYDLSALQAAFQTQQDALNQPQGQATNAFSAPASTLEPSTANFSPSLPLAPSPTNASQADYNALLTAALSGMNVGNGQTQPALDTSANSAVQTAPEQQQQQLLLSWLMGSAAPQPALDSLPHGTADSVDSTTPANQGGLSAQLVSQLADQVKQDIPFSAPLGSTTTTPATVQAGNTGAPGLLPSFNPGVDAQALPVGASVPDPNTRARQLLNDYYLKLYAFIPVLLSPEYIETFVHLYGSHRSAFLLSLECLLPMLDENLEHEPTEGAEAFNSPARQRRRQTATHYARLAGDAIDDVLETIEENANWGSLLEVLQALAVLAIYEYGSGRAVKARLRADQALGLAMSHGLHRLSSQSAFESLLGARSHSSSETDITEYFSYECLFEMSKRIWWVTWSLLMYASYNTGKLLTIRADDPRITSALPSSSDQNQPNTWVGNILTLQTLLLVQDRVLALSQSNDAEEAKQSAEPFSPPWTMESTEGSTSLAEASRMAGLARIPSLAPPPLGNQSGLSHQGADLAPRTSPGSSSSPRGQIIESMVAIDKALAFQIEQLEQQPLPWLSPSWPHRPTDLSQVEAGLVAYQRLGTGLQLYTAWLTLHLYSAFQGVSLFERKLCFLSCVNDENPKSPQTAGGGGGTPGMTTSRSRSLRNNSLSPVPIPDAYTAIFSDQSAHASNLPTGGDNTDWLTANMELSPDFTAPSTSAGDWLLHVAGIPVIDQATGQLQAPGIGGAADPASGMDSTALVADAKPQAPTGVFDARYSLDRCVYASKRLLEIMGHDELRANPFPSCSALLISYTLLMQVMSVSNDLISDFMADSDSDPSRNLLQSAQSSAALQTRPDGALDQASRQERLTVIVDIWDKVRMAHDVLVKLAQHYDMVVPMAQEVQVCLQASQMLFNQGTLDDGLYADAEDALP